ncbi:hypothetical protein H2509_03375 [Stappia sp. F7233]|uniref:Outer membrane protein beta-barrel domain-containing protein n=1 Tax=Stappia albiluteola TaxID=2758565 RepID=A0A839A976_9HYPH|nr:hypothetical protein [Stappia albiluteola]MBA5776160.1 hypothetical protein [Stappia albiluteola]
MLFAAEADAADYGASAQPTEEKPLIESGWEFQATLYLWATALTGTVGIGNLPDADVDISFADILEDLDAAVMGAFLAKNGDWLFLADLVYSDLSTRTTLNVANSPTLKLSQTLLIASAVGGYELPLGHPDLDLSVTAGVRYQRLTTETTLKSGVFPISVETDITEDWVDPVVGFLLHYDINDRWFVNAIADVGGFGVGSQFTTQGFLTVGYNWTDTVSTAFGYRALYTDYESGSGANRFEYETTLHGPFLSIGIHF